jgi:hypothetical protein
MEAATRSKLIAGSPLGSWSIREFSIGSCFSATMISATRSKAEEE